MKVVMPASTLEPVSAALRASISKNSSEEFLNNQLAGSARRVLCTNIEFEATENYQSTVLSNLKTKYIVLQPLPPAKSQQQSTINEPATEDQLEQPDTVLFPLEEVQLGWNKLLNWGIGSGLSNLGNTCYMNSTLQALFHVPAFANWIVSDSKHMQQCVNSTDTCMICIVSKILQQSLHPDVNVVRPSEIYNKLRFLSKHLTPGRQEDAHEFLRCLVEAMEKAYLNRFSNNLKSAPSTITSGSSSLPPIRKQLDERSKETTPLHQILGGYLRSSVRCLECGHVSTTYQHFQDLLLDIRKVNTVEEALDNYFAREKLDDMTYCCENCKKKVQATKQFSIERAPMVLCLQLKRFSMSAGKITKHISFRQRLELTRFFRRKSTSTPLLYRLVSVVTHLGQTLSCGHYTAIAMAPDGGFYLFDDSNVRPVSHQHLFSTNAYIMMYEMESTKSYDDDNVARDVKQSNGINGHSKEQIVEQVSQEQVDIKNSCFTSNIINDSLHLDESPHTGPKLVPYEVDDSSSSSGETSGAVASTSQWQTSKGVGSSRPSLQGQTPRWSPSPFTTDGYSTTGTTSWNKTSSSIEQEVLHNRHVDRKRSATEPNPDRDKIKLPKMTNGKASNSNSNGYYGNPFQEFSNNRKWQTDSHYYHNTSKNYYSNARQRKNYFFHRHQDKFRH